MSPGPRSRSTPPTFKGGWADLGSFGYDEFNWTYTPTGKRLLQTFADFSGGGYYVRPEGTASLEVSLPLPSASLLILEPVN